jgi:hypothetical protein
MRRFRFLLALLCVPVCPIAAQTESDTLLRQTFDTDTAGWLMIGQGGGVHVEDGSLAFSYEVKPKKFALAVLPAPPGLARLKRLRFRVRADHATALAVFLSEKKPGGGNYTATFWAPANTWQQVELTPADFSVSDGPNDPVDADGKLDLDAVDGIGLTDVAQFFLSQAEKPGFPAIVDRATGSHTLLLDDFELLAGPGSARAASLAIDRFDRGFLEWITMGGVQLRMAAKENPLGMPAMEAGYMQTEGHYGLLLRRLANLDLSRATRLAFDVASEREATLLVRGRSAKIDFEKRGKRKKRLPVGLILKAVESNLIAGFMKVLAGQNRFRAHFKLLADLNDGAGAREEKSGAAADLVVRHMQESFVPSGQRLQAEQHGAVHNYVGCGVLGRRRMIVRAVAEKQFVTKDIEPAVKDRLAGDKSFVQMHSFEQHSMTCCEARREALLERRACGKGALVFLQRSGRCGHRPEELRVRLRLREAA